MKKISFLLVFCLIAVVSQAQKYANYGEKFKPNNAVAVSSLTGNQQDVKVYGEVESVCQVKGCWMKVKMDDGSTMRVTFKDYGFFVPKDLAGKKVIIEGDAKVQETSVAELKHYAEDAGKSKAEIDKINAPKRELTFVADGVLVQQ